jgi:LysM repeat protein
MKSSVLKISILFVAGILQLQAKAEAPAEKRISRKEYITTWSAEAQKQMSLYGIPASITLAQGILESGDGNSPLARYAKNHFGIKCHDSWQGETFIQDDDRRNECFRKYESAEESFRDHSTFLKKTRYENLFKLDKTDYQAWARGLKNCGYATNPKYSDLLIQLIEENNLYQFDEVAAVEMKKPVAPTENKEFTTVSQYQHKINVTDNNIRYIVAKDGDTYYKIAKEFEMGLWQIYKYNDLSKKDVLQSGDVIYLQPKKNKAAVETHRVQEGETMHTISQRYGIKLKRLYQLNNIVPGSGDPEPGTLLHLRKKKKV